MASPLATCLFHGLDWNLRSFTPAKLPGLRQSADDKLEGFATRNSLTPGKPLSKWNFFVIHQLLGFPEDGLIDGKFLYLLHYESKLASSAVGAPGSTPANVTGACELTVTMEAATTPAATASTMAAWSAYLVATAKAYRLELEMKSTGRAFERRVTEQLQRISLLSKETAVLQNEVHYKELLQSSSTSLAEMYREAGLADGQLRHLGELLGEVHELADRISRVNQRVIFRNVEPVNQEALNAIFADLEQCLDSFAVETFAGLERCLREEEELEIKEMIAEEVSRCQELLEDIKDKSTKLSFANICLEQIGSGK
ncbi:hypothetical protein HPB47_027254 [Ixodes persulcatus]|uniref:Uncharacterized protein n=1 Tax=Ixodes persulcatus TaxID=34615 RepID=A0AC60PX37_IXOPE|nr:hypothetical protein HPB47_027254 [Ixodes persulcatus]